MLMWDDRPVEVANLLNPAFCGEVLRRCISAYEIQAAHHFPYPLVYLVLPIILPSKTRRRISTHQRHLHAWLHANPEIKVGFADRARSLVPVTREALSFLLLTSVVDLDDEGSVTNLRRTRRSPSVLIEGDVADCYSKAAVVGRWRARAGTTATIYAMWGVKP